LGKNEKDKKKMKNYNEKINVLDFTNSVKNASSIFKLAKTQETNIEKRFDENFIDLLFVCEETATIVRENKASDLVGKAKKANLEIQLDKMGLLEFYSQLGKNDKTAVLEIGNNPNTYHDAYYEKENTRVKTMRGIVSLVKKDKQEKTLQEKIESFIKSNTTKKADDGKMTIAEFTQEFSIVAHNMLKAQNSEIVSFLPKADDIAVNQ
jgi:hypothetical protein